jgi:hypothetical protein
MFSCLQKSFIKTYLQLLVHTFGSVSKTYHELFRVLLPQFLSQIVACGLCMGEHDTIGGPELFVTNIDTYLKWVCQVVWKDFSACEL